MRSKCTTSMALLGTAVIGSLLLWAAPPPPRVGLLNSVTGDVWVNGVPAKARSSLGPGGVIRTRDGLVELLLTPGAFLRLGERSELTLETDGTPNIRAKLKRGEALLEVLNVQSPIALQQNDTNTVIRKPGLYDFDEKHGRIEVYAGEAQVNKDKKQVIVDKSLGVKTRDLHKFRAMPHPGSMLLSWSASRSSQLSGESAASAQTWPADPGSWGGPAWYWNAWSASYTFLSASGFVTSPFGWPFFAPGYTHNYLPFPRGGDSFLYGPPTVSVPLSILPGVQGPAPSTPSVPLTAPGVPAFLKSR